MKLYTVGEVSKITGISKDMLRFYDNTGLVKPSFVDQKNNYRYYTYDQFWMFDIIQICRDLDVPLKKIGMILESKDDAKVLQLLKEHQQEAIRKSRYFRRVAENIDWYEEQTYQMQTDYDADTITIHHFPEQAVLLGKSDEDIQLYHLELQKLCRQAQICENSFCRHYGWVLDADKVKENRFLKRAEYLYFESSDSLKKVNEEKLTVLPEGDYACCVVKVKNDHADFSTIMEWCKKEKSNPEYIIADEIGLHLFHYKDQEYLCKVKVLLK